MRQFLFLLLTCFFSTHAFALFETDPPSYSSAIPGALSFDASVEEFLPLEQAYRLEVLRDEGHIYLDWDIADGYYLYRHRFSVELYLDGRRLPVSEHYEQGVVAYDEYYQKELEKFYHQTRITLKPEEKTLTGLLIKVGFQGCADAGLCYPPEQWTFSYDPTLALFTQVKEGSAIASREGGPTISGLSNLVVVDGYSDARLWVMLSFALLGGLLLNLMPCVFPVLSIKVMSFATHVARPSVLHRHGWSYTLGVITSLLLFAGILLLLKGAGKAVGWGFQLQSPVFVSLLIYLFFVLGLSFSGLINFGEKLMNFGSSMGKGNGYFSSFVTGALAVVVASPCSAPFMGVAMGYALSKSGLEVVLIFVFLGFGLAMPFLLLSYLPTLMNQLPRPGIWMVKLRNFLALPLYASTLWLLWVLSHQVGEGTLIFVVMGCVLIFVGVLLSRLAKSKQNYLGKWVAPVTLIFALAIPFSPWFSAEQRQLPVVGQQVQADGRWQVYTEEKLNELLLDKQAVFVNLTADWCITCLANEKNALSSERFYQMLESKGIYYLKGDWTNYNEEITRLLNQFGRSGVPLYLLFDKQGRVIVLPQLLRDSTVLGELNKL